MTRVQRIHDGVPQRIAHVGRVGELLLAVAGRLLRRRVVLQQNNGDRELFAAALDASSPEVPATACEVVALVGMQLLGPAAWPAALARNAGQRVHQFLEHPRVMPVGARDAKHQRDALPVRDEVAFAAELAPIGRVGARVRAPAGWPRWPRPS